MTYVVAWRTRTSAYMLADTAITEYNPQRQVLTEYSTFGERHIDEKCRTVQERLLKIENIDDRILVGYSGDVSTAIEFIRLFRIALAKTKNVLSALQYTELQKVDVDEYISIVAVYVDKKGPQLASYNAEGDRKIVTNKKTVHLGKMNERPDIINIVDDLISAFNQVKGAPGASDAHLINMNAAVRLIITHNPSLDLGVGGLIAGARVTQSGVRWQKDTVYFIYGGPSFHIITAVIVMFRSNGVVFVDLNSNYQAFFNQGTKQAAMDRVIREFKPMNENLFKRLAEGAAYYVFLSSPPLKSVSDVVTREKILIEKWLSFDITEQSTVDINVSKGLIDHINRPPE